MGNNIAIGHTLQYTIPRNLWFAARTIYERKFSLVGCTVSPGFEFFDFELGRERQLAEIYPDHASIISELTRG